MTIDALARLKAIKTKADDGEADRANYAAYVADRVENGGWSSDDVAEYKAEVGRIMANGTPNEKAAAREFWAHKAKRTGTDEGINARIRARIAAEKQDAA